MFGDAAFRDDLRLSAVNSINWARVMAQIVYYVTAARSLPGPITASVPSGNFGNVLSGWIARRMGAPIADFIVASNSNDILARFVNDADMSTREVVPTLSPSMDIQVSSNFERLLFEMNGRDGGLTSEQLPRFRAKGRLVDRGRSAGRVHRRLVPGGALRRRHHAGRDRPCLRQTGILIDPHTATGTHAAHVLGGTRRPVVTLATAHPANSRRRSSAPPGCIHNCRPTWPTCSSGRNAPRRSRTTWRTSSGSSNRSPADERDRGRSTRPRLSTSSGGCRAGTTPIR